MQDAFADLSLVGGAVAGRLGRFLRLFLELLLQEQLTRIFDVKFLTVQPWVLPDFVYGWPILALIVEYACDKVLELGRQLVTADLLPVFIVLFVV